MIWDNIFDLFGIETEEVIVQRTSDPSSNWEIDEVKIYNEWNLGRELKATSLFLGGIFLICFVALKEVFGESLICLRYLISGLFK